VEKSLLVEDFALMHNLAVKIRVEDTLTKEKFEKAKAIIAGIEKEYGGNHTLSIQLEVSF
jgi:hypothetical protein